MSLRKRAVADKKPGGEALHLRVRVDGGGCSGFKYDFVLETEAPAADDRSFTRSDVVGGGGDRAVLSSAPLVVVDEVSFGMVKGATVDWEEDLLRAAFVVANNPNAESSCGCKSSFAVKSA